MKDMIMRGVSHDFIIGIVCIVAVWFAGCGELPGGPVVDPRQLLLVRAASDSGRSGATGSYGMGVWRGNSIYCVTPFRRVDLDDSLRVVGDELIASNASGNFLDVDARGELALMVREYTQHLPYARLSLWNLHTGEVTLLMDSVSAVSSARFLHHSNGFIYYSYGDSATGKAAGYYHYDFESGDDTLILAQPTVARELEVVNGFDVSPDDERLIYPIHAAASSAKLGEFNLRTRTRSVFPVAFPEPYLWVRYDPAGSKIVYCSYFSAISGSTEWRATEIGILNLRSLKKSVLPTYWPWQQWGVGAVSVFPDWSPNAKNIVFGSAPGPYVYLGGNLGNYSLYVLTNVDWGMR